MKTCTKCSTQYQSRRCPKCLREYQKRYYYANAEQRKRQIGRSRKNTDIRKEKMRKLVNEIKSRPCTDCGIQYNPWVMEFDHLDTSQKDLEVSKMVGSGFSEETILKEIAKCEVVCANCHRERTYKRLRGLL